MENFLIKYGLWAVFFGSMIEADAMPVMSGAGAHFNYFSLAAAMAASGGGMFAGDCLWYLLGRAFGGRIEQSNFYRKHLPNAEKFVGKLGIWQILAARVIYGTRNATMLFWGIKKLNFAKFAAVDFAGCAVWTTLLAALGYFLSFAVKAVIGDIKRVEVGLLIILIFTAAIIAAVKYLKNKNLRGA